MNPFTFQEIEEVNESTQNVMACINKFPWGKTEITKSKSNQFRNLLSLHFQESSLVAILGN